MNINSEFIKNYRELMKSGLLDERCPKKIKPAIDLSCLWEFRLARFLKANFGDKVKRHKTSKKDSELDFVITKPTGENVFIEAVSGSFQTKNNQPIKLNFAKTTNDGSFDLDETPIAGVDAKSAEDYLSYIVLTITNAIYNKFGKKDSSNAFVKKYIKQDDNNDPFVLAIDLSKINAILGAVVVDLDDVILGSVVPIDFIKGATSYSDSDICSYRYFVDEKFGAGKIPNKNNKLIGLCSFTREEADEYKYLSAILVFKPTSLDIRENIPINDCLVLIHNPNAKNKLSEEYFKEIGTEIFIKEDDKKIYIEKHVKNEIIKFEVEKPNAAK